MNEQELIKAIREVLRKAHDEITPKVQKVEAIRKDMGDEFADGSQSRKLLIEQEELKIEIARMRRDTIEKAHRICSAAIEEVATLDDLKGEDVNDDIKLLTSGIPLTERDIEAIVNRNADNVTMQQLAYRYARDKGIKLNSYFIGHSQQIRSIENISEAVDYTKDYLGAPNGWSVITDMGF